MNKLIKTLCESIFDDTDDIIDNNPLDDVMNRLEDIRNLFDKLSEDDQRKMSDLMELLYHNKSWDDIYNKSIKSPISLYTIRVILYSKQNNINIMKRILDEFFYHDIKIDINYFEIVLSNDGNVYTNIKNDIIDFSKYTNIKVKHLEITHGSLENLEGIPYDIYKEVTFLWVRNIKSFKGFPKQKESDKFLDFNFCNSALPDDWTYFPKSIQKLELDVLHDLCYKNKKSTVDQLEDEKSQIIHYYKELNNFSDNFDIYSNYPPNGQYYGCMLINNSWPVEFKKFCRDYISKCLKKNGNKNIKYLKKILGNSLTYCNDGKKVYTTPF